MSRSDSLLSETDIRSQRAQVWAVRADAAARRPWLRRAPLCAALAQHQIAHLGLACTPSPFRIVRTRLGGSYFLSCFAGAGKVLVDGRWKLCRAGQAFLLPPGTLHAFHALSTGRWEFCWVRYQEQRGQKPIAAVGSPVLAQFTAEPLRDAVLGLYHECRQRALPGAIDHWLQLIELYVQSFARPAKMDVRLWKLWKKVAGSLSSPWTTRAMSVEAHLSPKHLERLCRRELGRTPRQQLMWLRMRRAAELLTGGLDKVEVIAAGVGYQNPFVFSRTFKRIMGWSPSLYPGRLRAARG
jgi:AraC-like DNA-binding protein